MSIEGALSFFLAIFIFGITPGPGVLAILARALVSGAGSCFFLALGMVLSDIIYLIFACFGLAALAHHWEGAFAVVRVCGAIYLIYLGLKTWRSARRAQEVSAENRPGGSRHLSFLQGFLISASNPKVILFYIAFLPTFIDLDSLDRSDIALASLLTLFALMAGLMLIAFGAASVRPYIRSARGRQTLNRSAGAVMIGAGSYLIGNS